MLDEQDKVTEAGYVRRTYQLPLTLQRLAQDMFTDEGEEGEEVPIRLIDKPYQDQDIAVFFKDAVFPFFGTETF